MQQLPKANKFNFEESETNRGVFSIEPLYPGYGTTLGNALRRVLLSSLPGSALIAFNINGALHEFSTLPHVKEDAVDIIINLKKVRLKIEFDTADEPIKFELKVKGEKKVTGADFKTPAGVTVINKNLHLMTLTDAAANVEMFVYANKGRGLVPLEQREDEKFEIGTISLDANYSPILEVGFTKENVRVGQMTNYDKLTLDLLTDGTIKPKEAFEEALNILVDQFDSFKDFGSSNEVEEVKEKASEKPVEEKAEKEEKEEPPVSKEEYPKEEEK